MANYCKYCGKLLQDGEICSCPQAQAEAAQQYQSQQPQQGYQQPPQGYQQPPQGYQQPPQGYQQPPQGYQQPPQPAAPNPIVVALQKIVPYIQSYFKAPVSAAQNLVAQKDMIFAAVLLCIQLIVSGLLLFSMVGSYLNNCQLVMGGAVVTVMQPYMGDRMGDYIDISEVESISKFSANFFMSLIFGILAAAIAIAIFMLIAFAVSKISGSSCSIKDVVVASAAHTPLVTILLLLSFICFFIYLPLGVILLLAATLAWMVLTIPMLQMLAPNAGQGKFWICTFVGLLAALLIGGWAAYNIGSMAVDSATYKDDGKSYTVKELREEKSAVFMLSILG